MSNILKRFNRIFDIESGMEEEKAAFINRINQTLFFRVEETRSPKTYEEIFHFLCYSLGFDANDKVRQANAYNFGSRNIPSVQSLTTGQFIPTIKVIILLYDYFSDHGNMQKEISEWVEIALSASNEEIGLRWKNGMFYPSGAKMLDEKLIDDVIGVLNEKDKNAILTSYLKGLKEFQESKKDKSKLKNVARDMQLSLDETSKVLLGDKNVGFKHLLKDKNWDEIVKNKFYQKIFIQLNEFADKLAKHKAEAAFDEHEVETFVYLTGIFIRLVFIQK